MSGSSSSRTDQESAARKKFKGVRRRKWGKWVSEIRVPGKQDRLWLESLNFPLMLPASVREDMSPKSIQKVASDAGMAIDAQMILNRVPENELETELCEPAGGDHGGNWHGNNTGMREGDISIEDYL
ncbi:hypothetical protein H0E87_022551 [Populus deltoides]|uniref:AP2/ERF domain-containing protein n=1 Tax=Populus deltoides TaxID=3696 RepID=A0A8T2XAN2_POPDE|nr:hypothetical protein H0E87_022551 [Populus deltoides]